MQSTYKTIFLDGLFRYLDLLEENQQNTIVFQGHYCKKYIFEQIRVITELFGWIEEYMEWVRERPYFLQFVLQGCRQYKREIEKAIRYYLINHFLLSSEQTKLYWFRRNLTRFQRRIVRCIKCK